MTLGDRLYAFRLHVAAKIFEMIPECSPEDAPVRSL
jgi:hypothetical protein